ncbi:MAG: (Fe-S)-binding protein [Deltaproteobacteria bacterium]|nr:(Fe-S)-binding protein [Deltaproteobacteria bacterium]
MSEPKVPIPELGDVVVQTGGDTLYKCMQCGLCYASCPWRLVEGEIPDEFNVRKVQHMAQLGVEGYESDNVLFACTTCGACKVRCTREVNPIDNQRVLRAMIAEAGSVPPVYRPVIASLRDNGNPWQGERSERLDWAKEIDLPRFEEDTEYLLFVCCTSCYDKRCTDIAKAIVSVLKKAGVSFGIIGEEESCCGESVRKIGGEDTFQSLASSNIQLFKDKGVKKIITTSPHCLFTFRNEYSELGGEFEVAHYTEILGGLVKEGKLKIDGELAKKVIFHDPCYLGRHNEVYDAPRDVLDAVPKAERVEMTRCREDSICCGGGGGRIWTETDPGARFGDLRIKDAMNQKADVVATTCPYCTIMLDASNITDGSEDLAIKDIAEILDELV